MIDEALAATAVRRMRPAAAALIARAGSSAMAAGCAAGPVEPGSVPTPQQFVDRETLPSCGEVTLAQGDEIPAENLACLEEADRGRRGAGRHASDDRGRPGRRSTTAVLPGGGWEAYLDGSMDRYGGAVMVHGLPRCEGHRRPRRPARALRSEGAADAPVAASAPGPAPRWPNLGLTGHDQTRPQPSHPRAHRGRALHRHRRLRHVGPRAHVPGARHPRVGFGPRRQPGAAGPRRTSAPPCTSGTTRRTSAMPTPSSTPAPSGRRTPSSSRRRSEGCRSSTARRRSTG